MGDVEDGKPLLGGQAKTAKSIAAESAKLEAHYHETQEIANLRLWWGPVSYTHLTLPTIYSV